MIEGTATFTPYPPGGTPDLKRTRRQKLSEPSRVDRLPPYSLEAEQGVLGCILLDPGLCLPELLNRFKSLPALFYDVRHQTLISEMLAMYEEQAGGIDVITLQQRLRDKGMFEGVGGLAYLSSLQDAVPSAANLIYYADIVAEKALLRRGIQTCNDWIQNAYEFQGDVNELLDTLETSVLQVTEGKDSTSNARSAKDLVALSLTAIEAAYNQQGVPMGIATGFPDFDKMTDGLHPGEMIVIAARPSMGKTSLAMNIADHVATVTKLPVGVFSLEMTAESLMTRMLCSLARVNLRLIKEGFLAESALPKITGAAGKLKAAPLWIDDSSSLSIMQLRAKARRMYSQHGIRLLIVDYMQLVTSPSPRSSENRQVEISDVSNGLKALAKELNIPVIVLSQLNRDVEKQGAGARPKLSQLRESGTIEQDADLVALLYKPASEDDDSGADAIPVNLIIAKQRNGPTGEVHLTFLKQFTRFESAAKVDMDDVPEQIYQKNLPYKDQ